MKKTKDTIYIKFLNWQTSRWRLQ